MRKRDPNDKNYSVANPFGLQYASQAPVVQWIAPRTGIELIDPLQTDEQVSMINTPRSEKWYIGFIEIKYAPDFYFWQP